jgi:signal transduction histidine kinase
MPEERRFARLVSLACHDLRTPLATVYGFARTLSRVELDEAPARYVEMIGLASQQIGELLDELGLVARIEGGRFDPVLTEVDSLGLARAAAQLEDGTLSVSGEGALVRVEEESTTKALARLARAAARHGGFDSVELAVTGADLELSPVGRAAAPVLLGEQLRELGPAAAVALIEALGGSLALQDERLLIRLPAA